MLWTKGSPVIFLFFLYFPRTTTDSTPMPLLFLFSFSLIFHLYSPLFMHGHLSNFSVSSHPLVMISRTLIHTMFHIVFHLIPYLLVSTCVSPLCFNLCFKGCGCNTKHISRHLLRGDVPQFVHLFYTVLSVYNSV